MSRFLAAMALILFAGSFAHAGVAADKEWTKALDKGGETLKDANKKCGTSIKFDVKRNTFKEDKYSEVGTILWAAAEGVMNVCDDADFKKAFAAKVKTIEVKFGAKDDYKMNGSTYQMTTDLGVTDNAAGQRDKTTEFLKKSL